MLRVMIARAAVLPRPGGIGNAPRATCSALRGHAFLSGEMDELTVKSEDSARTGVTEPTRIGGNRVEHRLHVGLRLAHDPQNLARRRLLL